ncbi:MAG: hypothetical protein PHR34_01010 [Kiritimatiellae bacterium]|nr:hypothetical protein [Kiritimatiellia bacterium]MDD3439932.1 hypothetical protein [Kiritimatiellia bacterium]
MTFNVQNNSDPGDANNLISFNLTGISGMGIFGATLPNTWTYSYDDESKTLSFSGNGSYLSPGNADTFRIFSTHTNTAQGAANAVADGLGFPEPFPPLETLGPSEHPARHVVRVEHTVPGDWAGVAGGLGDVRINGVATNELEVAHGAAVTVSVQRVLGHPEDSGRRLVVKEIRVAEP